MTTYSSNLTAWGDSGSEYPSGYSYIEGEQPVDAWDNFFNSNVQIDIDHLINVTNERLDSTRSDTAPTSPTKGQQWYDSTNGNLEYYNDVDGVWRTVATENWVKNEAFDTSKFATLSENETITGSWTFNSPLNISAASDHIQLTETDASNKQWVIESNSEKFKVRESGVGEHFGINPGGAIDVADINVDNINVSGDISGGRFISSNSSLVQSRRGDPEDGVMMGAYDNSNGGFNAHITPVKDGTNLWGNNITFDKGTETWTFKSAKFTSNVSMDGNAINDVGGVSVNRINLMDVGGIRDSIIGHASDSSFFIAPVDDSNSTIWGDDFRYDNSSSRWICGTVLETKEHIKTAQGYGVVSPSQQRRIYVGNSFPSEAENGDILLEPA
ncbi:hypothetical protein [Halocatena halophila]|uniref:hypothetical protein n=1 Tax=Halocatena halophila TaxID=2814576 RepID=UPI002ED67B9B